MKLTSIRMRLALWNVGILALALLVVLAAVHIAVRSYMLTNIDRRMQEMTDGYMNRLAHPPPPRPEGRDSTPPNTQDRDRDQMRNRFSRGIRTFDLEGHLMERGWRIAETQEQPWDRAAYLLAKQGEEVYSTANGEEAPMRLLTRPIVRDDKRIGVVQVSYPLADVQMVQQGLTTILLVLIPCVLLLAGIGGLFLTGRALRPVRAIAQAADALNAEDLSYRLPVAGGDEFAQLAMTINRMLARLDGAFQQLRQSIERERQFTADASHELRTPLTAIKANASLALRGERSPAEYRDALKAITRASDTMHHLVQDLLLLARADSGQLAAEHQPVEARALLEAVAATAEHGGPHATVSYAIDPSAGAILGDQHQLQRLLINLLENALRHTPPEGEVTLGATGREGTVVLTVTDTGEGIAAEHMPHLGERFYRADAARARQHGGAGLGLAICKSIVEAHQGTMTLESAPGQGTRVIVTLPAATD